MHARDLAIDIWRVFDAAATKPFGFSRFDPGPGVGGHYLPVDPSFLGWNIRRRLGRAFRFVELANEINDHMPDYVARRVAQLLNDRERAVRGARVLLLGLAYKRGSSDWRESPAIALARRLAGLGAHLRLRDPHVEAAAEIGLDARRVGFTDFEPRAAEVVVLAVAHLEFEPARIARWARLVFDTRGVMRGQPFAGEILSTPRWARKEVGPQGARGSPAGEEVLP